MRTFPCRVRSLLVPSAVGVTLLACMAIATEPPPKKLYRSMPGCINSGESLVQPGLAVFCAGNMKWSLPDPWGDSINGVGHTVDEWVMVRRRFYDVNAGENGITMVQAWCDDAPSGLHRTSCTRTSDGRLVCCFIAGPLPPPGFHGNAMVPKAVKP